MNPSSDNPGVIRGAAVRRMSQPALVDCSSKGPGDTTRPISVVPLLDGERIAGFEIRCGCGAAAVVECVYEKEN